MTVREIFFAPTFGKLKNYTYLCSRIGEWIDLYACNHEKKC